MQFIKNLTKAKDVLFKAGNGIELMRISLGIVFIWFGILKFFPGVSPAESVASRTIFKLTFGLMEADIALPVLATWECIIGIGLITTIWMRTTLVLLYLQMFGTFLPLIFFPHESWKIILFVPTLLGQYIIKNCVLLTAGIVLGDTSTTSRKV